MSPDDFIHGALVDVDKRQINHVIRNLLSNAFNFTPKGGRITVSVRLCHRMGGYKRRIPQILSSRGPYYPSFRQAMKMSVSGSSIAPESPLSMSIRHCSGGVSGNFSCSGNQSGNLTPPEEAEENLTTPTTQNTTGFHSLANLESGLAEYMNISTSGLTNGPHSDVHSDPHTAQSSHPGTARDSREISIVEQSGSPAIVLKRRSTFINNKNISTSNRECESKQSHEVTALFTHLNTMEALQSKDKTRPVESIKSESRFRQNIWKMGVRKLDISKKLLMKNSKAPQFLIIEVTDTGIGIAKVSYCLCFCDSC